MILKSISITVERHPLIVNVKTKENIHTKITRDRVYITDIKVNKLMEDKVIIQK